MIRRFFQALDGKTSTRSKSYQAEREDPVFEYRRGYWIIVESSHIPISQDPSLHFSTDADTRPAAPAKK